MKKKIYFVLFFVIVFSLTLSASLLDVYKSGKIKLVPDPNFGKGTDWDIYFPQGIKDIAFAKDGSFFATGMGNKACHCIYKFDRSGKFVKKIGRKGRGPGDLYHPGALSILDNKYLLVAEYATNRRISVFDLNGNFVKIIKTSEPVFDVVGLKGDTVLIATFSSRKSGNLVIFSHNFYIRNIVTDKEKKILILKDKSKSGGFFRMPMFSGKGIIVRNGDYVFIGASFFPEIYIFNFNGKKVKEINLGYKKKRVNNELKEALYKYLEYTMRKNKRFIDLLKKEYKKGLLFPEYEQLYRYFMKDGESNILVVRNYEGLIFKEKEGELEAKGNIKIDIFNRRGNFVKTIMIDNNVKENPFTTPRVWGIGNFFYYFGDGKLSRISLTRVKKIKIGGKE